jgi:hypothetical protein
MDFLQSTETLSSFRAVSIGGVVGFVLCFLLCRTAVGGKYLDEIVWSVQKAQALVDRMSHGQRTKHLLVTCVLDSAFPVFYGLCLAGWALRVSPLEGVWSVLPAIFAVLFDVCENGTHVFALTKGKVPRLKPLFTVLKFTFIIIAAINILAGCIISR